MSKAIGIFGMSARLVRMSLGACAVAAAALSASTASAAPQFIVDFNGTSAPKGSTPTNTQLISDGTWLYGMTNNGGAVSDKGVIFKVMPDGTSYSVMHEFTGNPGDGSNPRGSLTLSGATLYGMTQTGGTSNLGTIYKIGTDGAGYAVIHNFTGNPGDGSNPRGSLTLSGSTLYGMTNSGGTNDLGTIFSLPKNATTATPTTIMRSFASGDGTSPQGSLTLSIDGTRLYGMTNFGGTNAKGTIFKINISDSAFTLMHEFTGSAIVPVDGQYPGPASLTLSADDSTLYGITNAGGVSNKGTIFSLPTNADTATPITIMRSFNTSDGESPRGILTFSSATTLYGTTTYGGTNSVGTIFKIDTDGNNFLTTYSFDASSGGKRPSDALLIQNGKYYGMTEAGGTYTYGTIFTLAQSLEARREALPEGRALLRWSNRNEDGVASYLVQVPKDGGWTTVDSFASGEGAYSARIPEGDCRLLAEGVDGSFHAFPVDIP